MPPARTFPSASSPPRLPRPEDAHDFPVLLLGRRDQGGFAHAEPLDLVGQQDELARPGARPFTALEEALGLRVGRLRLSQEFPSPP